MDYGRNSVPTWSVHLSDCPFYFICFSSLLSFHTPGHIQPPIQFICHRKRVQAPKQAIERPISGHGAAAKLTLSAPPPARPRPHSGESDLFMPATLGPLLEARSGDTARGRRGGGRERRRGGDDDEQRARGHGRWSVDGKNKITD